MPTIAKMGAPEHSLKCEVIRVWAQLRKDNKNHTAKAVHDHIRIHWGHDVISYNTVNKFVKEARRRAEAHEIPDVPWSPWAGEGSSEEHDFLLEMNTLSLAWLRKPLSSHEARWARMIRASVAALSPFTQWILVRQYAFVDNFRVLLGGDRAPTYALDSLLAIKPWLSNERQQLWFAAAYNDTLFKGDLELAWVDPVDDPDLLYDVITELKCESTDREPPIANWEDLTSGQLGGWDESKGRIRAVDNDWMVAQSVGYE